MVQVAPAELLQTIRAEWNERRDDNEAMPRAPADSVIRQILEAAFWTSMRTEEQRTLSFRVAYCAPTEVEEDKDTRAPLLFAEPKPLTVPQLLRLSPALDFRQSLVGVCRRAELGDGGDAQSGAGGPEADELVIWGIVDSGLSWWEHTKGEPRRRVHRSPPPSRFTVSSNQPGTLSISCGGHVLLSIRDGEVAASITHLLRQGPVGRFFAERGTRMVREVVDELEADFDDADEATNAEIDATYVTFIEGVLACMREFNHGGALLLVPGDWTARDPRVIERLRIKFPTQATSTWEVLKEYLRRLNLSMRATEAATRSEQVSRGFMLDYLVTRHKRHMSEDLVRDRASLLASLTKVDGALVLTRSLELLGFGAEIVWSAPELDEVYVAQDVEASAVTTLSLHHFGTRHRSAFRFCHSHPGVLALILSSDGDLRVARRLDSAEGTRVVMWQGLDSPELGL
jgi:hypothetical protein